MPANRRTFIKRSGSIASGIWLASLEQYIPAPPKFMENNTFKLIVLATNWGFNGSVDEYCSKVQKEGYDGIEIWWPVEKSAQDELFVCLKKYSMQVGFLCGAHQEKYDEHFP